MFSRLKSALYNVVGSLDPGDGSSLAGMGAGITSGFSPPSLTSSAPRPSNISREKTFRFPYTRPHFLQLNSEDEVQVTADHAIRPIIVPRDITRLPWNSGYAETINAGKSRHNEDQSTIHVGLLTRVIKCDEHQIHSKRPGKAHSLYTNVNPGCGTKKDYNEVKEQTVLLKPSGSEHVNATNVSNKLMGAVSPSGDEAGSLTISLPYYYFGVFDGHAGWGAAVSASNQLHQIIHEKLCAVLDFILPDVIPEDCGVGACSSSGGSAFTCRPMGSVLLKSKEITPETAITGALELAFWQMDQVIAEDRYKYHLTGGCTACIGVFILGKLYVANAGDSRSIIGRSGIDHPMSFDFTPETETQRIRKLGAQHPELLGGEYTHLDFQRKPINRDLGKKVPYRDHFMTGWSYKVLTEDDFKTPLVSGEGKRSRVLATIGVTRGFGDHDLKAIGSSSIFIKPFLSSEPQVKIFNVETEELTDSDVLILATDGLWDIISNENAAAMVDNSLSQFPHDDQHRFKYRYTGAAQDMVMGSRGKLKEHNWRTAEEKHATIDDISVFVIPIRPYQVEYLAWRDNYQALRTILSNCYKRLTPSEVSPTKAANSVPVPPDPVVPLSGIGIINDIVTGVLNEGSSIDNPLSIDNNDDDNVDDDQGPYQSPNLAVSLDPLEDYFKDCKPNENVKTSTIDTTTIPANVLASNTTNNTIANTAPTPTSTSSSSNLNDNS